MWGRVGGARQRREPSILLEQLEIERGEPSSGTPPLLPAPERAPADARGGAR